MSNPKITLTAEHAAQALSLTIEQFLDLVRGSVLPPPIALGHHLRWPVSHLVDVIHDMDLVSGSAVSEMALKDFGIDLD